MRKTWTAILIGLALGFLLMGALIRGCEPGAIGDSEVVPASRLANAPTSRMPSRPIASVAPDLRSTFESSPAGRSVITATPGSDIPSPQRRSPNTSPNANIPGGAGLDGMALARNMAASRARTGQSQELLARSLAAGDSRPRITDAEIRDEMARRGELLGGQVGEQTLSTLDARALAVDRLRSATDSARAESPSGSDRRNAGGDGSPNSANPGSGNNSLTELLASALAERPGNSATVFNNSNSIIGGGAPPPTPQTPPTPSTPPAPPPGSSGGGGAVTTPPPVDTSPPLPVLSPVSAVWIPVTQNDACATSRDTRTNDLFIAFTQPTSVQLITSAPPLSLNIVGGSFVQDSRGGNSPPNPGSLAASPCVAFDSYLTMGDRDDFLFAAAPPPDDWGLSLNAVWVTPIPSTPDAIPGVPAVRDPERFGDDRYYIQIARITATANPQFVGGTIIVDTLNPQTLSTQAFIVTIPNRPPNWFIDNAGAPQFAITGFEFDQSTSVAGELRALTVTIDQPAPAGGVEVILGSSSPFFPLPDSIVIHEGRTTGGILINTPGVPGFIDITVSARLGQTTVFASLTIEPAPTDIILSGVSVTPAVVRAGEIAVGVVTLARVAPPGGRVVELSIDDPSLATIPASVIVPAGETVATFDIRAASISDRRNARIWAAVGEQIRTATFLVTSRSDLNADGIIDGADLLFVLNDFGSMTGSLADLNNDGQVDGLDLLIILNAFNTTPAPTAPDPFSGDVIARWIPAEITSPCTSLDGFRSNDLFLGFNGQPRPDAMVLTSQAANQIRIADGSFFQIPGPFGSNSPPNPAGLQFEPCLLFDSYLTIAEGAPNFVILPNPDDWSFALNAIWFSLDTPRMLIERSVAKFGDDRFYVRIGRFTANEGARVDGSIVVDFILAGSTQLSREAVPVANCPVCWRSFDLTGDGLVDAEDIQRLMSLIGTDDPAADLDGDGVVTASDLALMVQRVSSGD